MSASTVSDWRNGVLTAARWLKEKDQRALGEKMLDDLLSIDSEGTEARIVKLIATYVREWAITVYANVGEDVGGKIDIDLSALAENIERGEWRPK